MASLILGTAGSIVGGMVGGPIGAQVGWLVGAFVGNLVDPPKVEGPRRTDLKLQRAEYGVPIPRVWGTGRIAGVIIDQTDLEEHKETSGGKGGPEVTTYTYSASFDIALCVGPIVGILRIWADGRLIYNIDAGDSLPCTVYLGTETQEPDPTFEAVHGVGNVPAYRGLAHVVFSDYMLTEFGDRIPLLEFEVFTAGGDIPWRVASFDWQVLNYNTQQVVMMEDGHFRVYLSGGTGYTSTYVKEYDRAGNQIGNTIFADATAPQTNWAPRNLNVLNCRVNPTDYIWYIWNENLRAWEQGYDASSYSLTHTTTGRSIYKNGFIYAISGTTTMAGSPSGDVDTVVRLVRWACPGGVPGAPDGVTGNVYTNNSASTYYFGDSDDDYIYVVSGATNGAIDSLYKFNAELELVYYWDAAALAGTNIADFYTGTFVVYGGLVAMCTSVGSNVYNIALTRINEDHTLTDEGVLLSQTQGNMWYIGNGLGLDQTGIFSMNPPPEAVLLSEVVADLSDLTSVTAYDVSELATDTVRWFHVGNQMTVRNAIETLRRGYQFDAVESDDTVKFRKRGATDSVVTIDEDDLVAREYGADGGTPLVTTRKKEQGMPRNLTVRYIDVDQDYNTGAQNSPRITTLSDTDVTLDLSIGFTANEAQQIAWKLQLSDWIERESFTWQTTRKYAWVEPCDVVTVRGRVIRITKRTETPNGVISWEGVLHRASVYTQEATGAPASGFTEQTTSADVVATQLVLLDIPILSQADAPFGFYAAMGPVSEGNWRGASLYKSLDGGVNYTSVATTRTPAIIGNTVSSDSGSPVGSPTISGALGSWSGDTVDESSICVRLTDPDAELSSCTATALANGANYCAISFGNPGGSPLQQTWELCQFRDATLVEPRTYILSGFMRGRKGSSTVGHAAGDVFVLLSTVVNVDAPESELNLTLLYKGVTFGRSLAQTPAQEFRNTGLGAEEYFGVEVEHFPIYGENPLSGSPSGQGAGLVPPIEGVCDSDYFLNQCGEWAIPPGTSSNVKVIQCACSDQTTALSAGTAKVTFRMPYAMTVTAVRASLQTAASGSPSVTTQIDINENGSSILSTKLTIDHGEKTSTTAATPAVVSDASLADDAEITIDLDTVGGGAIGLVVSIIGT